MCNINYLKREKKNEQQRHSSLLMTIKQRQCVHLKILNWNMHELFNTHRKTKTKKKLRIGLILKRKKEIDTHTHTHTNNTFLVRPNHLDFDV